MSEVEAVPTKTNIYKITNGFDCFMCEQLVFKDKVRFSGCDHLHHKLCAMKWYVENKSCPICRAAGDSLVYEDGRLVCEDLPEPIQPEPVEPLDKCSLCDQALSDGQQLAFLTCCMSKGLEHEFHLSCLISKCNIIGPYCPHCYDSSISITTNGGREIFFNHLENSFPVEQEPHIEEDQDIYMEIKPCALCMEPVFENDWYGCLSVCEPGDHVFHLFCLAIHFMDYGAYCPWCEEEGNFILEEDYGGLHFDPSDRKFYTHDNNGGRTFIM
ncbi:hypothetical protein B4U80_12086 [Leptotrombidium deliense]|uniref:RING-type domain-containing protein n=1 Tax=Leptotrombidium deliense TaxID=299467 RepID=A0A443RYL3_9ACAR|nr:hypothetical protein B4U80_12086 [Leptotrombidium deliense]